MLAGGSPAGPFQAGSVAKGGGNASPGAVDCRGSGDEGGWVMGQGGECCAPWGKRHGVYASHLPRIDGRSSVRNSPLAVCRAGQGAHREVGSEGFAAKRRAVAEGGEPVGQIQAEASLHYGGEANTWNAWTQRGVCGRHGGKAARVTPGGLVRSRLTWRVPGRISRCGEVAGDAVREVGVTRGTQEPETNTSSGTVPSEGRRAATQTAPTRGKGSRWRWQAGRRKGRVGASGLMVAAAMTEVLVPRIPPSPVRGAR